jgi:RNA polymerase sigma factor (sigma-70 family)
VPSVARAPGELSVLVERSCKGDRNALNTLVASLIDDVYRLALRMTGNPADAEDAAQEVMIKVVTHLGGFRGEASVRTWTYRIAVRHLLERRKGPVEALGLDFERFAADLAEGFDPRATSGSAAAEEVKLGCTLAMLTCLDREHRVAYVLGDVFDLPSSIAAVVADVPDATYRQRLSRARRKVEAFTTTYCGVVNPHAACRCEGRVARAIELGRLDPHRLQLRDHPTTRVLEHVREMESLHATAALFRRHPEYAAPEAVIRNLTDLLSSGALKVLEG